MSASQSKNRRTTVLLGLLSLVALGSTMACVQSEPEPTPDIATTIRDAVNESLPAPVAQPDIAATARAVVQESLPTAVVVPDAEATARAVVHESLPEPGTIPDVQATAQAIVQESLPPPVEIPNAEATARAILQSSIPTPIIVPDVEATVRSLVSDELSIALQTLPMPGIKGSELRAMMQNMVAIRRYDGSDRPISLDEVMLQATKFEDRSDIPSQFRLEYNNFIGLWLNNQTLETWIQDNVGTTEVRGVCCYYLDVNEPALYRAAILNLPELTQLINDAEGLGIDSRYLAEALERFQDGYTIVYESFTW